MKRYVLFICVNVKRGTVQEGGRFIAQGHCAASPNRAKVSRVSCSKG